MKEKAARLLLVVSLVLALPSLAVGMSEDAFMKLCESGSAAEVQAAIKIGANINTKTGLDGNTPLI